MTATSARRSPWAVAVPLVTLAAGLLFAAGATTSGGTDLRGSERDLPGLIRSRTVAVERQAAQNTALRDGIATAEAARPAGARLAQLRADQDEARLQAGLTPVTGPAVRVSLDDAGLTADALPDGVTVDDVVVHQQDVQAVVNALWAAGAEAMTIQDQRIVSTSAIRCVGNTLILQGRVYSPPFVVTAIGDQARLQAGLDTDPAVGVYREYADRLGLGYRVKTLTAELGGYAGSVDPVHATVPRPTASPTAPS